ncbi:hypothetical protein ACO0LM_26955 [Undibacterium sp. Di26W]|uniref:hypothetical protein n=1 Tax=Undibacterium sp. Di26W TaxID=3413035 RepID=UPI003BF3599D
MLIFIVIAATLLMLASVWGLVGIWRFAKSGVTPKNWKKLVFSTVGAGVLLGLLSSLATFWMLFPYPNSLGPGWFAGLPFVAVYVDGNDNHYHFSFTQASVIANACFWFLLPFAFLRVYAAIWRRQQLGAE